jgi:hypothetical protein
MFVPTVAGAAALDQIGRVEWSSLAHAYSGAGYDFTKYAVPMNDVVAVLRGLFDADPEIRLDAHHGVLSTIWHQGTIYEVTAAVVPFLAAFVADKRTPNRGRIFAELVLIAATAAAKGVAHGEATRSALADSAPWLSRAAELGPELARRAVASITAGAVEGIDQLAGELEGWGDSEDTPPEESPAQIRRELEESARRVPGAPYAVQSGALGRGEYFLRRAPALVLAVTEAIDHAEIDARRRLVRLQALALVGRRDQALDELRRFVDEWLGPARLGAVNQAVARGAVLRACEPFDGRDVEVIRRQVRDAPEPQLVLPDGDSF